MGAGMNEKDLIPRSELFDETFEMTLIEIADRGAVKTELVIQMVHEGILEPHGDAPQEWRFRGPDLLRLNRALRLLRDLELNLPGAALAVDLLDELDELRARIDSLEKGLL